ncbi:MAG TPA: response regulator transcription factor [Cyclobacteriaceae bacterium]|nr:response regulator transcription factor [Cyclobacteriaceae bacterium]
MNKINLLLVDDHNMVREGLKSIFENDVQYNIAAEAVNGIEAIKTLKDTKVDIVLTDISMPGMDGVELTKAIKKNNPDQKVIALTMMGESQHIRQMLKAGVSGYLLKNCGSTELKKAIQKVMGGETYFSPEVSQIIMNDLTGKHASRMATEYELSEREKEVLHLIVKEYSNQEIADTLFISTRTVDAHKRNLLDKTGSKNIAGLVLYAIEKRLFDDI